MSRVEWKKTAAGKGKEHFLLDQAISIKMPEHTKLGIGRSLLHAAVLY